MKLFYLLTSLFFFFKISYTLYEYNQTESITEHEITLTQIKPIGFDFELNQECYIFTDKGWNIKRKKKKVTVAVENNQTTHQPLKLNLTTFPITLCQNQECFEFMGLQNNQALFYGTTESGNKGFIKVKKDDHLTQQILISNIESKKITFFDLDFNKTLEINMFDLNISQYKPTTNKDTNNATQ